MQYFIKKVKMSVEPKSRFFDAEYCMCDTVAIWWWKYKLLLVANGTSEIIFLSIKIEITMSLTILYKLNMIKCSLGCTLFNKLIYW